MNINFRFDRETKGAVRYQETADDDDVFVGTLYIRKAKLGKISAEYASTGKVPDNITATLTEGKKK